MKGPEKKLRERKIERRWILDECDLVDAASLGRDRKLLARLKRLEKLVAKLHELDPPEEPEELEPMERLRG